jgi:VIT1/CCC1 family predicted Fe2+/Mn2+ transporter
MVSKMEIQPDLRQRLITFQRHEINEFHIYQWLASIVQSSEKSRVLEKIAQDELCHYQEWRKYTGQDVKPDTLVTWKYHLISRVLGFSFSIKLLMRSEDKARIFSAELYNAISKIDAWIQDENAHKQALIGILDEEQLEYDGSVVLGINDALVELTGVLAVLTLALQDVKQIAASGLITGIAAAIVLALSEYLFTRSDTIRKHPLRAAIYTGIICILVVTILILPYLLCENIFLDLILALGIAVLIIAACNSYISVAKDEPFRKRFLEMAGLSLGLAGVLFPVGYMIRIYLGIDS